MPIFESDFEKNLYAARQQTLHDIAKLGIASGLSEAEATYPNRFPAEGQADTVPGIRATYDHAPAAEFELAVAEGKPINVAVAGRIMAIRAQGKAGFAQLQGDGQRLQIYVRKDAVGDTAFALYKLLDLGDHIGVHGYLFRTRTGELSVHVTTLTFLAKSMLALPDKYHGLEDVELRYRQRYVDLIMNSGNLNKVVSLTPPGTPGTPGGPGTFSEPGSASPENPAERPAASPGSSPALTPFLSPQPSAEPSHIVPPGSSPVTELAAPNQEHMDAPRNVREVFVKRAAILRAIRRFFDERGFLEVETPMMHTVAGGAAARPFKTHHNALDLDLSLRIAPELFLKRLVVGGLDRVYEINRNFRNEGVSTQHNPEFTMLEFYQAYSNYHDLMALTEELVTKVATEVNGTPITHFNSKKIDLSKWTKLSMREAIVKFWPPDAGPAPTLEILQNIVSLSEHLAQAANLLDIEVRNSWAPNNRSKTRISEHTLEIARRFSAIHTRVNGILGAPSHLASENRKVHASALGNSIADVFEAVAEARLIDPTIIYDFPLAVSPLSKQKPDEPDWVERFEFYIGGFEVGNAFSELNDPEEQEKRFEQQLAEREGGDPEAHVMDEDYVRALGYGLPPTAGEGIGIDRLTMLLTGSRSIRDVILFPLLRPQPTHHPDPTSISSPDPLAEPVSDPSPS